MLDIKKNILNLKKLNFKNFSIEPKIKFDSTTNLDKYFGVLKLYLKAYKI